MISCYWWEVFSWSNLFHYFYLPRDVISLSCCCYYTLTFTNRGYHILEFFDFSLLDPQLVQSSKLLVASLSCAELGTAQPQLVFTWIPGYICLFELKFQKCILKNMHLVPRNQAKSKYWANIAKIIVHRPMQSCLLVHFENVLQFFNIFNLWISFEMFRNFKHRGLLKAYSFIWFCILPMLSISFFSIYPNFLFFPFPQILSILFLFSTSGCIF